MIYSSVRIKRLVLLILYLLTLPAFAFGAQYVAATQTPDEILKFVLRSEKLAREEVAVVLLKYDYLKREWHIELMPSKNACLDCYPSYYVNDTEPLKIKKIPHG